MALSVDEANTVSSRYFDDTITSLVYEDSPYFSKLKAMGKVTWNGGVQIQWPIRYQELGVATPTTPRSQLVYSQKETRTGAVLDYAFYYGHAMISWDERVKNSGKPQIIDLLKDKTEEMNADMQKKFATDLFTVTANQSALSLQSLDTIISTGSFAGIASADASAWVSNQNTTQTRLVLYGATGSLAHMINLCTFGRNMPSLMVTTRDLYNKAESIIEPQKHYEDVMQGDAGFTTVKFHGISIVSDVYCTASYFYLIDVDKYELRYNPDYNFKVSPWTELIQAGYPNAMAKVVSWAGNHLCRMRQTSGKFTALDYTL